MSDALRSIARSMRELAAGFEGYEAAVKADPEAQAYLKIFDHDARERAVKRAWRLSDPDRAAAREKLKKPGGLLFLTASDLNGLDSPLDFIRGVFYDGQLSVIFGPPGSGKSFFAMDAAANVALGRPWAGRLTERRNTLVIALEGVGWLKSRVRAWALHNGAEPPLQFGVGNLDLRSPVDAKALIAHMKENGIRWLLVDTLARSMAGGNENSPEDMGALIAGADAIRTATGAHVTLIHHTGKNESNGARGHSSLRGAVDVEIELTRNKDQREARVTKSKDGPEGASFPFTLTPQKTDLVDARGDLLGSAIISFTDRFEDLDNMDTRDREALAVLKALIELERILGGGVTVESWRDALKRKSWAGELKPGAWRMAWARTRKQLSNASLISVTGDVVELTQ